MDNQLHDVASNVEAECGEVQVDGPNGLTVSFTPEAAEKTGQRLIDKAAIARDQNRETPEVPVPEEMEDKGNFA